MQTAVTGAEALALCREQAFDAITLDLLLPDMSGLNVLKAIQDDGPNRDVPVIAVTVIAEKGSAARFRIHDYLVKPVRTEALLASPANGPAPEDPMRSGQRTTTRTETRDGRRTDPDH